MPDELKDQAKALAPAAPKKEMPKIEVSETCPECDAPMVVRQSRRWGKNNVFLGCSKYPKCKGTREAPPEVLEQLQASPA